MKAETERCLKCGATVVDQNKCLGCGLCTTRCKFDAIHITKKFDVPVHSLPFRGPFVHNYRKEREKKIALRKIREGETAR
jgi:ferredoxin